MTEIKCIICGQLKASSVEHIIPKSMGNRDLTIKLVCKECNSAMGKQIDGPFINNFIVESKRMELNLRGYKGKLPNPYKEGMDTEGNKIRIEEDFKPEFIPKIAQTNEGFSILASNKEEAHEMGIKKLKRIGASEEIFERFIKDLNNTEVESIQPEVHFKFEINFKHIKIGFLKIAYEYMYLLVGNEYYKDNIGGNIRDILQKTINNESVEYDSLIFKAPLNSENILKNIDDAHLIIPTINKKNQIFISIFLFNGLLSFSILASENSQNYFNLNYSPRIVQIKN